MIELLLSAFLVTKSLVLPEVLPRSSFLSLRGWVSGCSLQVLQLVFSLCIPLALGC